MKYGTWIFLAVLLAAPCVRAGWFQEVEISADPPAEGKIDFTVRMRPAQTREYDKLVFECTYHQEFPWEDERGRKYTKTFEPVTFIYERNDVKMVTDLDRYISFHVPIARELLEAKYGTKTFNKGYPITVSRIRVTGMTGGQPLWSYELPAHGTLDAAALENQKASDAANQPGAADDIPPVDKNEKKK